MALLRVRALSITVLSFLVLHFSHALNFDRPILICHMDRTVTVDISSADSAWEYVDVVSQQPPNEICRSDALKEGLIFNIDNDCMLEMRENATHRTFTIVIRAKLRAVIERAEDTTFNYNCSHPLKYSGPDRVFEPIFSNGRYFLEEGNATTLSSHSTTILIIVVAVALFVLVTLIVGIVCVTCDCFGKRRFRHRPRLRRHRKPRDPSTRY